MKKVLKIVLIIFIFIAFIPYNSSAITLGEYEQKLQQYIDQYNKNQAALNKTEEEIKQTNNEIANIKTEIQNLSNEIEKINNDIIEYNEEIKEKSLQTKEIFQYFQMANGENVYLEYVFGADTITDLIYRMSIVEQMTEYNNKITKELEEMIEKNKEREKEIEAKKVTLNDKTKQLQDKLVSLGNQRNSLSVGSRSIQDEVRTYQDIVDSLKKQGCLSHHVIGVDCATYGSVVGFRRPIAQGYITSEFGGRWGSIHRGLDMSNDDPYHTKIYPVANGTIISKWQDVNGALIVAIEHYSALNNTYYTSIYGHLSSYAPNIYSGKYVTTDDYIGYMGNTGYSFGAHLHLEMATCRLYTDPICINWDAYVAYVNSIYNQGFKGPRGIINFPSGLYNPWYTR